MSEPKQRLSLILLREVAQELGYEPLDEQLSPIHQQILDRLFDLPPQVIVGPEFPKRYRSIAKRVLRKRVR